MIKKIFYFAFFVICLLLLTSAVEAESGKTLVENSANFDGKTVVFRGEVIGVMIRGDFAWVNVLDDEVAIGIWVRAEDARKISFVGDYKHIGDLVEVVGTFHMTCPEHGGDLDIHADKFIVLSVGRELDRPLNLPFTMLSIGLVGGAIILALYLRHVRREREKMIPVPSY